MSCERRFVYRGFTAGVCNGLYKLRLDFQRFPFDYCKARHRRYPQ